MTPTTTTAAAATATTTTTTTTTTVTRTAAATTTTVVTNSAFSRLRRISTRIVAVLLFSSRPPFLALKLARSLARRSPLYPRVLRYFRPRGASVCQFHAICTFVDKRENTLSRRYSAPLFHACSSDNRDVPNAFSGTRRIWRTLDILNAITNSM